MHRFNLNFSHFSFTPLTKLIRWNVLRRSAVERISFTTTTTLSKRYQFSDKDKAMSETEPTWVKCAVRPIIQTCSSPTHLGKFDPIFPGTSVNSFFHSPLPLFHFSIFYWIFLRRPHPVECPRIMVIHIPHCFRKNYSTLGHRHTLNQIVVNSQEYFQNVNIAFIDNNKTFDSPDHQYIFKTLNS